MLKALFRIATASRLVREAAGQILNKMATAVFDGAIIIAVAMLCLMIYLAVYTGFNQEITVYYGYHRLNRNTLHAKYCCRTNTALSF